MLLRMQSPPQHESEAPALVGQDCAQSHPLRFRLVVPRLDAPNYTVVGPSDRLYRAARLAARLRRSRPLDGAVLALALEPAWPVARGERPKRGRRAVAAAGIAAHFDPGERVFEVAERLDVTLDAARRLIKDGEPLLDSPEATHDCLPWVEVDPLSLAEAMAGQPRDA
jgi:hypothetical protein